MTDFQPQPLDPIRLPLQGSQLIEASAGTGKTFTIALLYVRLILGRESPDTAESGEDSPGTVPGPLDRGLEPPRLLVVTFTEAATQELRERIRSWLGMAAQVFGEAVAPGDDRAEIRLLTDLRQAHYPDPATWSACRRRLQLAAEWMDEAMITTIHGWCHRMLAEHAFDSGNLFRQRLENDQRELFDEVARDYWRTFVYPLPADQAAEFCRYWPDPETLAKRLKPLLGSLSESDGAETPAQTLQRIDEQRRQAVRNHKSHPWTEWRDEVVDILDSLKADKRLNGNSHRSMVQAWDRLLAWAGSDESLPERLDSAGFKNQTPTGLREKVKGEPLPAHPAFEAIAELLAFNPDDWDPRPGILRHAAGWCGGRFETEKLRRAEMGFDDLLNRLDGALRGPRGERLADTIRGQFPAALIDEFQDTDPVQYRIFDRIYRMADNDPRSCLLMIGDPKQAIYGFRGADIHTYLRAREAVGRRIHTLDTNYRSSTAMVEAVNGLFSAADRQLADGAFLFGQGASARLPFLPVQAKGSKRRWSLREGDGAEAGPALRFQVLEEEEGKPLTKEAAREGQAGNCATEIARLLNLGRAGQAGFQGPEGDLEPLKPGDIAILVNNFQEAGAVRAALAGLGVKSVYLSDRDSVLQSPVAMEVLLWLRAAAEPNQLDRIRAALAAPSLDRSWEALDELLNNEARLEQAIDRFTAYQHLWQTRGVLPMLRRLLMEFDVPARLLAQADGERRLTDLLHIAEILQEESQYLDGEHALLHHYNRLLSEETADEEHHILRLESDAGLVKVVTVHKSKGLEYPLVFLPFATEHRRLGSGRGKKAPDFIRLHDEQGRPRTVFAPTEDDLARADRERLGEDIRKLYVALTRARHATWVGVAAIRDWHHSGLGHLLGGTGAEQPAEALRALLGPSVSLGLGLMEEGPAYREDSARPEPGPARRSRRTPPDDWWIASYSALRYGGPKAGPVDPRREISDREEQDLLEAAGAAPAPVPMASTPDPHGFPGGAEAGSFLHDMLEWCARTGFQRVLDDPALLRDRLRVRCRLRGWEDWVEPLNRWLRRLLERPLALPGAEAPVPLAGLASVQPEMEFWLESRQVATARLDALAREGLLVGRRRPALVPEQLNGMLKGFIDLVFEHEGRYYVMDYKSNRLGAADGDYSRQAMADAVLARRYDLQYLLYLLALHRLLRARLPDYRIDRHLGGAVYYFLRGCEGPEGGLFVDRPDANLIERLDALFVGEAHEH